MRKRILVTAAAALVMVMAPTAARANPSVPGVDAASVEQFVQDYSKNAGYPGVSVAITKGGDVLLAKGYGVDSAGVPLTGQTPMPVASLSKSFTALAMMQLVEASKVDLDKPVHTYLPEFEIADPRGTQITVRQLLNQTSGITDGTLKEKSLPQPSSLEDAVVRARAATLAVDPGSKYYYTNTNYHIAARLVEVVSGERFGDYLSRHIFAPLGMTATRSVEMAPDDGLARGHVFAYGASIPATEPRRFVAGSDGIVTTAEDYAKYLMMQANGGQLVTAQSLKTMHSPSASSGTYGLGWDTDAQGRIKHSGVWFTHTAYQLITPSGYGIAVMSNSGLGLGNEGTFGLAQGLADLREGKTPDSGTPVRLIIDLVLAGFTLLSVALGIRTLRRSRLWAQKMAGRPLWTVMARLLPRFVPLAVLITLPQLLGMLYGGGRDITHYQLLYYSAALVIWSAAASAMGAAVAGTRIAALVRLRQAKACG